MRIDRERSQDTDEVELKKYVRELWDKRLLIASIAIISTLLAAVYIYFVKPVYEAKAFVQPPTQNDIAALNYGRGGDSGLPLLTAKGIYDVYLRALHSESLRREFFRKYYLPVVASSGSAYSSDELYEKFSKVVEVAQASKSFQDSYSVSARANNPDRAAEWAGRYTEMAAGYAKQEVLNGVKSDVLMIVSNIEQQISIAQESAQRQREDRIAQLKEALLVAKSIGLERPPIIANNLSGELSASMEGSLTYMRGSQALQSEIDNLEKRPSNDPYIKSLRNKQADLAFYRGLNIKPDDIQVFRQDGVIELPDQPIKPNPPLVLAIGVLGGLLLGVGLVCILLIWRETFRGEGGRAVR
ncbi:LPS O-antigen chain length determinant protein WzzB [Pseudomonas fontis]|uniref:Wzz/FepE/Etk N-terminal domain-containing protein n=1 Tax=Pseudomonas fontis TaxID=2942633 RepID=A0ABT5NVM9_9PSED|nr:Wzz/FepE/Etk N-terminal domain-containing protein [Pseudomonas fontis]MDD0975545.1 Wzz/FepE/Etk N-terminal domain-containing protein [Pseudomonas fontis]MDD0992163.1 Wzz/FepE/Etk N-terminal domain-containing protein [Pseudomonas fontis]